MKFKIGSSCHSNVRNLRYRSYFRKGLTALDPHNWKSKGLVIRGAFESILMAFFGQVFSSPYLLFMFGVVKRMEATKMLGSFSTIRRLRLDESLVPMLYFYSTFKHLFILFLFCYATFLVYKYIFKNEFSTHLVSCTKLTIPIWWHKARRRHNGCHKWPIMSKEETAMVPHTEVSQAGGLGHVLFHLIQEAE